MQVFNDVLENGGVPNTELYLVTMLPNQKLDGSMESRSFFIGTREDVAKRHSHLEAENWSVRVRKELKLGV